MHHCPEDGQFFGEALQNIKKAFKHKKDLLKIHAYLERYLSVESDI